METIFYILYYIIFYRCQEFYILPDIDIITGVKLKLQFLVLGKRNTHFIKWIIAAKTLVYNWNYSIAFKLFGNTLNAELPAQILEAKMWKAMIIQQAMKQNDLHGQ